MRPPPADQNAPFVPSGPLPERTKGAFGTIRRSGQGGGVGDWAGCYVGGCKCVTNGDSMSVTVRQSAAKDGTLPAAPSPQVRDCMWLLYRQTHRSHAVAPGGLSFYGCKASPPAAATWSLFHSVGKHCVVCGYCIGKPTATPAETGQGGLCRSGCCTVTASA